MGGCASKPKESDNTPVEAPSTPEKPAQLETATQDNANVGGESPNGKPLVDLSEPEKEAQQAAGESSSDEPKAAAAAEPAKATEEDDKVNAPKNVVDVEVTEKSTVPAAAKEAEDEKPTAEPSKEQAVKTDAPLVSL